MSAQPNRVSSANPIFDIDKLDWYNGVYIRGMSVAKLAGMAKPFATEAGIDVAENGDAYFEQAVALEQERVKRLSDFGDAIRFFFVERVDPDMKFLVKKKGTPEETASALQRVVALVTEHDVDDMEKSEELLRGLADELGWKAGELFMPIRVAITGSRATPPLFQTMRVLGKERVTNRLALAAHQLLQRDSPAP